MKLSRITIISFMALAGLLSSCKDEFLDDPAADVARLEGYYFHIAGIGAPVSRTAYPDATHSDFEEGDRVGIFTLDTEGKEVQQNLLYTVVGNPGGLQALKEEGSKANEGADYKYLVYYPYDAAMTLDRLKNLAYTVRADQDKDEEDADGLTSFERSDFLWDMAAVATDESGTPKTDSEGRQFVEVVMDHVGATIIINVVSGFGSGAEPTILSMQRTVTNGIDLTAAPTVQALREAVFDETVTASTLEYKADDKSDLAMQKKAIKSDSGVPESQNNTFRVVVPPQIIESGQEVVSFAGIKFKYTGADGKPLALKPGMRYTFHVNDPTKPFIDIDDDDTWIFDVVDPVTGKKVGLLCREYIRYQPDHMTDRDKNLMTPDHITGYPITLDDGTQTKAISSQVWVFYDLWKFVKDKDHDFEDSLQYRLQNEGYKDNDDPYLDSGIALRFINDARYFGNVEENHDEALLAGYDQDEVDLFNTNDVQCWPAPHENIELNGGMFLSKHGRTWIKNGNHGESSQRQHEFWMHGGKIYWGYFEWATGFRFNGVKLFVMPDEKVTTDQAVRYGHINIIRGSDGDPIGAEVSYEPYLPSDRNVGVLVPKYINDARNPDEGVITYPLVKIGYNNIWSKKGLRSRYYNDGKEIPCYQESGFIFNFPHLFEIDGGIFDTNKDEYVSGKQSWEKPTAWGENFDLSQLDIPGSYAFSYSPYFDVYDYLKGIEKDTGEAARNEVEKIYTKLYNFSAILYEKDRLVPGNQSYDKRMSCYIPRIVRYYELMNYVGWMSAVKTMTNHMTIRKSGYTLTAAEIAEGYKNQELITQGVGNQEMNAYAANVTGLDLRAIGMYRYYNGAFVNAGFHGDLPSGIHVAFWMDGDPSHTPIQNEPYFNRREKDCMAIMQYNIWTCWASNFSNAQGVIDDIFVYGNNGYIDGTPVTNQAMWNGADKRSRIYCAVRPVLKFNHQNGPNPHEKTVSAVSAVRGIANRIKNAAETPAVKPQSRVTRAGDTDVSVVLTPSTAF